MFSSRISMVPTSHTHPMMNAVTLLVVHNDRKTRPRKRNSGKIGKWPPIGMENKAGREWIEQVATNQR